MRGRAVRHPRARAPASCCSHSVSGSAVLLCALAGVPGWSGTHVSALDNGVGLTPPMGWSSWNVFAGDIDEEKIRSTIDAMAGLLNAGYEYVNVDDNWMEPTRDADGNLQTRKDKFPRGMKYLADYAHGKGLKFGIYSAHGAKTCQGNAASYGHYQQDADLFASWGVDYLKLDSCGGYPANYSAHTVEEQYREYAAMRDALNATGRPIYYSICEINSVLPSAAVTTSPSSCGKTSAYTSLPWQKAGYDVPGLANSVLVEWVNNNNNFCVLGPPRAASSTLELVPCSAPAAQQQRWTAEKDGSLRSGGLCLDAANCGTQDGTAVALYACHPAGTAECGYKNQQWELAFGAGVSPTITNVNSGACLTTTLQGGGSFSTTRCTAAAAQSQAFEVSEGGQLQHAPPGGNRSCLVTSSSAHDPCCRSGWVSQVDSQQDLALDELSAPGYWNDNDMLSVGCNDAGHNGTTGTPCAGHQSLLEQRGQFALWAILASPLILGHDVRTMGADVRAIIANKDMIELNQDPLGYRARIVYQSDGYNRTLTTFVKKLAAPTSPRAAALFNRGSSAAKMTLTRTQLGFDAGSPCMCVDLRDLDTHKTVASGVRAEALYTANVLPHEVRTLRATCC